MSAMEQGGVPVFLLVLAAGSLVVNGCMRRGGYLAFPSVCGAFFLVWVAPPLIALRGDPSLPAESLERLSWMTLFCLGAVYLGWLTGRPAAGPTRPTRPSMAIGDLVVPTVVLTVFVFGIHILMRLQPAEELAKSRWSGPLTILAFCAQVRIVPLYWSIVLVLHQRSWQTITLLLVNIAITLPIAVVYLRRTDLMVILLAALLALWFRRRAVLPVPVLIGLVLGLSVIVYSIGALRTAASADAKATGSYKGLLSANVLQNVEFADEVSSSLEASPEMRNAVYLIDVVSMTDQYTWGAEAWNRVVFQYVPGQLVGYDWKSSMMMEIPTPELINPFFIVGTTTTGFATAYQEAGYFGALFFAAIGFALRRMWSSAMAGSVWAQSVYATTIAFALGAFVHFHAYVLTATPLIISTIVLTMAVVESRARCSLRRRSFKGNGRFAVVG